MNSEVTRSEESRRALLPYESAIDKARENFNRAAGDSGLDYENEKIFAVQALTKNEYTLTTANRNPLSVHLAMLNLAATGLTLNPAFKYAHLIPRDGAIVLDIPYMGLLKAATDSGSILWGRAAEVYKADAFTYHGPASAPQHVSNPFGGDRGEIVGVYCIAKTIDGDILTDVMDMAELEKIRAKSDAFRKSGKGPWVEWFSEQAKKAVIKRAQKTWPRTDRTERLLRTIDIANASEGGYTLDAEPVVPVTAEQAATIRDWIETARVIPEQFLALYDVETVEALPRLRYSEIIATLKVKANGPA